MGRARPHFVTSNPKADVESLREIWQSGPFDLTGLPGAANELIGQLVSALPGKGESAIPRGVVALRGEMGAGKTTLVKALCAAWGVQDDAVSPTFGLVQCYQGPGRSIFHLDLYRLKHEEEAWDLGLTEYFDGDGLNFVEWPEQAPGLLPSDAVLLEVKVIGLQHDGMRHLILSSPA